MYIARILGYLTADARYVVVINTDNWLTSPIGTPREKSICAMYPGSLLQSTNKSVSLVCPDSTLPGRYLVISQLSAETAGQTTTHRLPGIRLCQLQKKYGD